MDQNNLGNSLNRLMRNAVSAILQFGEHLQLTYSSYSETIEKIQSDQENDLYTITYPIGYTNDNKPQLGKKNYKKEDLLDQFNYLSEHSLAINGVYQLVIVVEAVLADLLRKVILKYPKKIGGKRSIKSSTVLACNSIEELHLKTADALLNELSYKSPREFSVEVENIISINLLEQPAYHKYIELKATRDILIHNLGVANDIYVAKAASHARAKVGESLLVDIHYFLESYEQCLQLIEWLEGALHEIWPSSERDQRLAKSEDDKTQDGNLADKSS